ncbi:unnamed protein product [Adineta steineri]|uniref:Uncharacterized protein n=1 Tax=Adineta steineri TaxID=433720 RepID=A0A815DMS3_9BILA|nr:unnamed protein product [Adineta steineri]CAF1300349.1 unnamed protein product [Adineta steineri]
MPTLNGIYILCDDESRREEWIQKWSKIKGVFTNIEHLCEALQLDVKQCDQDSIGVSFVTINDGVSTDNSNQLGFSFMYSQIFKEIILELDHDMKSITDLAVYCRQFYLGNINQLKIIDEFEHDYRSQSAIWWYTRKCFIYRMLNHAFRTLNADTLVNMGFFIRDLHQQIEQLYLQQINDRGGKPFLVYHGQGLLKTDFEKLLKTKCGFMFFHNFIFASTKQEAALKFARGSIGKTDMIGILFVISIDPRVLSSPFASIEEVSYSKREKEILFSIHTVFRVGTVKQIDKNNQLYHVELQLVANDDEQLRALTKPIGEETSCNTGWQRLCTLLLSTGQLEKAEELCKALLEQTSDPNEKALYYHQLGLINQNQGNYKKSIRYYEQGLEIYRKILPANHHNLAISYNNIGLVYDNIGEYEKALSFYEQAIEIYQTNLPADYPSLATSYNNSGLVYDSMGNYSQALSFYQEAFDIELKTLPSDHPLLAATCDNIGGVYNNMGEYTKALLFNNQALEIYKKNLPENHLNLAQSYNNIACVHHNMKEYSTALSYFERALSIWQPLLPPTHPQLINVEKSIEILKEKL